MESNGVFLFEDGGAVGRDVFSERAPGNAVGISGGMSGRRRSGGPTFEQAHKALFALVLFPVVEAIDAMEAGEDAVLPRMIVGAIFGEDDTP